MIVKYKFDVKQMYLVNGVLCCYKFCVILKPIPYHLLSDFSICPTILYTSASWMTQAQRFSVRNRQEQQQKCLKFVVTVHQLFVVWIVRCPQSVFQQVEIVIVPYQHDL